MLNYDGYEDLIVQMLTRDGWLVSPLPSVADIDNPQPVSNPRIYVIFTGSTFEDSDRLGEFAQDETLTFEVYIHARSRDGEKGVFAVVEEVIQKIIKQRLPDATQRTVLTSFSYVRGLQNIWQYVLKFTFPCIRIMPEPEIDPLLIKQITISSFVKVKSDTDEEI